MGKPPKYPKRESFLSDILPKDEGFLTAYDNLGPRELAIVSAAALDTALTELLEHRLIDNRDEVRKFLGTSTEFSPCSTFAAKIQLAYLVGMLDQRTVESLRIIKDIRNVFAHWVNPTFDCTEIKAATSRLLNLLEESMPQEKGDGRAARLIENMKKRIKVRSTEGEYILLVVAFALQKAFARMYGRVNRLSSDSVVPRNATAVRPSEASAPLTG